MRFITYMSMVCFFLLVIGCTTSTAIVQTKELKDDPEWPKIRLMTQKVIEEKGREEKLEWSFVLAEHDTGFLFPISKINNIWLVQACADYPYHNLGRIVDIEINSEGQLVKYSRRWKNKSSE